MEALKKDIHSKIESGELNKDSIANVTASKVKSSEIYAKICQSGAWMQYPQRMQLFKLALLIPPSTSGVECGFSVMNLLVSPLRTGLNKTNVDRLMRICINGSDSLNV